MPLVLFASSFLTGQITVVEPDIDFGVDEVDIDRPDIRFNLSPCTQYTALGSTVGLWDWRATTFDVVFYQDNQNNPTFRNIGSPFFYPGPNVNHLGFLNSEAQDFEPSDGWELLYLNLGTAEKPVQEPSFGLYNRLDGRFRIFFYIEPNDGGGPNNVMVRLSNLEQVAAVNATALFENLNIPQNALSSFDKTVSLGGLVQVNEGEAGLEWYLLEGVANYDPCVCQYESALEVEPTLVNVLSLDFDMAGTGTSTATYEPSKPFSALGYFGGLAGTVTAGLKKYKDATSYKAESDSNADKTIKVLSNTIGGIFGGATGILDLLGFITGKKSSNVAPKLTGFNHNFSFEANGSLEEEDAYDTYFFYTPGSFYNVNQLEAFRPIYDNPLGVFAVLEAPVVERQDEISVIEGPAPYFDVTEVNTIRWRFKGGLQYHINTLAGISDRPVELLASLVWTDCENQADFYATPAINITCLEDYVVEFEDIYINTTDPGSGQDFDTQRFLGCDSEPQLQIVAVLSSTAPNPGQEILYSARYATTTEVVPTGTIGENPFAGLSLEEINANCTGAIPRPLPDFFLNRYCDRQYNPSVGRSNANVGDDEGEPTTGIEHNETEFSVFPNPFASQLNVIIKDSWVDQPLRFALFDAVGKKVWSRESILNASGNQPLGNNFGHLPPGTYLLTISGESFTENVTVQKQ